MRRSPTESEAALWRLIKGRRLGVSFKRQVPLLGYIVDFYASEARLVVEVDGGYHAERVALDAKRQMRLERAGYRVVRVACELVLREPEVALAWVRAGLVHFSLSGLSAASIGRAIRCASGARRPLG